MRHKSFWLAVGIVIFLATGAGSALAMLVRHEPSFYHRCAISPGPERVKSSGEFVNEFTNRLLGGVLDKRQWDARFSEQQINSYFQEDFVDKHNEENPLPAGMSEPRVALDTDRIRVGFRYGTGIWSTVITIDVRAWLVAKEANMIALEFRSLHAGAIPISAQWLLERVSDSARQRDIEVTWYRNQGHPVLVLRFQAQRTSPTFQLLKLKLQDGMLLIAGRSLDSSPLIALP
jgi:hypothetical protein